MAFARLAEDKHVVILAYFFVVFSFSSTLNVPKVLLPYYHGERPINFTLEATDGCYSWRSARPEIASVQAVPTESGKYCSNIATVTALSSHPTRLNTIVFAEEQGTGHILRCDVIVDVINSIDIVTTTRVLYLDNSPEQFEVRALDDEGNTFSSLEGLQFEWSLISDTEGDRVIDANTILRILPFEPTPYTPAPYIADMEKRGQQGDVILVEGIKTGTAKVSTKLKAFGFREVKPSIVRLIVIDNLMLNPSHDVYLLVHAQIQYGVEKLRQGKLTPVRLPSPQYWLEVKDNNIATLNAKTSIVTGTKHGHTDIILKDMNVREELSQPTAGIHVVEPGYLGFVVLPSRNWVLETGRKYEIIIEVYDKDSHKIHHSQNIQIKVEFAKEYFEVLYSSNNGSYHIVETLLQGVTEIDAALVSVLKPDGVIEKLPIPVADKQEVEIFNPIVVSPQTVAFPWQPGKESAYQYTLQATGGSGNYSWSSSNKEICSVNVHGTVSTTQGVGETIITASDIRNVAHFGTAKVYVLPPDDVQFLPAKVEAEIGTTLDLPLTVSTTIKATGHKLLFTDCRHIAFQIHIVDGSVFKQVSEDVVLLAGSCSVIRITALTAGNTQVNVLYNEHNLKLQASITVAAYLPLKSLDPEELAVVALGSSKTLVLSGGPQPWILDPSRYYQNIKIVEDSGMLKLTHLKGYGPTKNYHLFHAVCLDFGEKMLKVIVGNNPTSKNHFPATTNTTIRISCAKPTSLHLIPVIKQPVLEKPCPITPDSHSQIPVHHSQNLEIIVVVADNNGHNFDNFSSLIVTWETSDKSLAGFVDPVTLVTDEDGDYPGSKSLRAVQNAVLTAKLGLVSVTATIVGYDTKLLRARSINLAPKIIPTISKSLELILVKDALITPSTISIFNHPSSMVSLIVSGGSGYFYIESSQQNIAQIKYLEKKKEIQVTPQFDGSVVITANDLCLYSPTHAVSHVYISGVNLIEVRVVDKVEINKDITASVRVLDSKNKPLQQRYFELMGLKPHPSSNIITVRHDTEHSYDEFTAYYIIHGMSLGRTSLSFVASLKNGQTVSSRPKDIQVFPSLRLNPRNVTLIIGAVFQVHSFGGPQPQSHIEYSIDDKNIANINGSGLIEALSLGHTRINGKAQGFDTETGETVVYSQDQIDVYVVRLTAINVYAPLSRLETAAEMPVYAIGVNEHQTPFTFGHAIPGLKFYWTVSNVDVITLSTVYHKIGIDSSDENNFGMRLHAINPGQATVRLKVTISQSGHNQILDDMVLIDEVQIEVFAKLSLIHPDTCSSMLLMSHNTQTQIKTNRDGSARVSYSLLNLFDGEPVITIDSMGYVNSRSLTGQTSVLITSHEEFGINQTAVVLVKVKPVSYLAINCEMAVTTMERKLYSFPVGISLFFTISFHDDLGEKFHSTNSELNFRINRFDLLQVNQGLENGTFVARATSSGNTIFKVWDKNSPHIADYVNVPVDSVITPKDSSHITVGDIVCFNSPLVKLDGQRGHWNSMDGSILFVDFHSGVGIATRPGTTTVYQNLTDNFVTHTEITVHAVQDISIDDTAVMYVSNLPKDEPYKIPVVLGEMSNNVKGDNCSQEILQSMYNRLTLHSVPFQCIIKFDNNADIRAQDLFGVTTAFDVKNGQYYCSISQMQMLHSLQLLSTIDSTLQLSVSVLRQDNQPLIKSRIVSLPFLPAFYISQSDITISNKHPQTELVVHGIKKVLDTVQVLCNDSSVVEVKTGVDVGASKRYPITLLDTVSPLRQGSVSVHIEVTSTLTGQSQLLPVKIPLMGTDEKHEPVKLAGWARVVQIIANNYQSWLYNIMIVLATIGALFIGYHFLVAPRYYHSAALNRSGVFLQPGQGSPPPYMATPPHSHGSPIRSPYYGDIPSMSPSRRKSPKLWSTGVHHPDRSDSFH